MAEVMQKSTSPESSLSFQLSVEQERDSYKEKVEHLKLLLRQYQQELQTQNIRKEGMETVTRLLQESKQENSNLLKKNRTLDTVVRNLQSRLKSNGLSESIATEETDMFFPGTSKQLLDNLARENSRLRSVLKGASLDPEDVLQLRQTLNDKIQELEEVHKVLQIRNVRISELEHILDSSDNEKDVEIKRLRKEVLELSENSRTREVLCTTLAEETQKLRQQLHDVAAKCQDMARCLDQNNKAGSRSVGEKQTKTSGQEENEEIEKLREENFNFHSKLEEVTKMNHRWQTYNNSQEERIRQLEQDLETLQAYSVTPEHSESINRALDEAKEKLNNLEFQKHRLQEELEESRNLLIHQSEAMEKLRIELENSRQHDSQFNSNAETMEALRAQIQICTEDFESERSDREKAQNRISQLEEELEQIKRERDALTRNRQHHVNVEQNFLTGQGMYNDFTLTPTNNAYPYENQLAARGPTGPYSPVDMTEVDSQLQIDAEPELETIKKQTQKNTDIKESSETADKNSAKRENRSGSVVTGSDIRLSISVPSLNDFEEVCVSGDMDSGNGSQILTCPTCGKEFKPEKHSDLLEHLDICM